MEVLYSNIIKIVIVELNKKGKATPGMLTARQSWSLYFLHSHPDHLTSISLAKRVMEDVLKDIKETDTICTMTKMQREAGQTHFFKNADNPIDQSGIIYYIRGQMSPVLFPEMPLSPPVPFPCSPNVQFEPTDVPRHSRGKHVAPAPCRFFFNGSRWSKEGIQHLLPMCPSLIHRGVQ